MAEDGLAGLTTKSVSRKADVSTAAIHYFFDTKDNLVHSAFGFVVRSIRQQLLDVRKSEPSDPLRRIRRSLGVFFASDQTTGAAIKIWPQLWVSAATDAQTGRLFKAYNSRMISNFVYDLREAGLSREEARLQAFKLNALHRGLWIDENIGGVISPSENANIIDRVMEEIAAQIKGA